MIGVVVVVVGIVVVWLACGVLGAGFLFAHFQRTYPSLAEKERRKDAVTALVCLFFGPCALIGEVAIGSFRYGWLLPSFRTIRYEERMRALARATGLALFADATDEHKEEA